MGLFRKETAEAGIPGEVRRRVRAVRAAGTAGFLIVAVSVVGALVAAPERGAEVIGPEPTPSTADTPALVNGRPRVTPVEGPSWLRHLGLAVSETRMGQMGGTGAAPVTGRREPEVGEGGGNTSSLLRSVMGRFLSLLRSNRAQASATLGNTFLLAGADLYRLNCQSCHGPDGEGAPPEIRSLIDPVRGTSADAIEKRMKDAGHPISEAMARQLASQAEATIYDRLRHGGQKMPPFKHLRGDEVEALLGYLDVLAGVPAGARGKLLVPQSAARVGEHLVKGTCHICHDATGPGGGHMTMMRGIIPSLASFPRELSLSLVERQVQYGSSGMMMMMGGETMPALSYTTEEEVAAAYFYLEEYPPQP
jgi:mono/diheme cytochrome c family protein